MSGLAGVISVDAGDSSDWDSGSHGLALKNDGTVWAWGPNRFGELGNGSSIYMNAPSDVKNLAGAVAVAPARGTAWR